MIARLSTLDRKALRDLWALRTQALAIALVLAAGVGVVVMSLGMIRSLEATRTAYYERYAFADVFAPAKRVPMATLRQIGEVPGVAAAIGRISTGALVDVPGVREPVTTRVHSLPADDGGALNRLVLRSGRWPRPERPDEVIVNEKFAQASRLALGERISAILHGKRQELRIVGTALSPEYVYAIGPGQIFPDNRRFGVLWMDHRALAAALDMEEAVNEVLIRLARGSSEPAVLHAVDRLLAPYGGTFAYPRREQLSDRFLANELSELATMTAILPPIFLGVAAFLINIVLVRLIDAQRGSIGLMMAFGYRAKPIVLHFAKIAVLLALPGLLLGCALGVWLGRGLAGLYQNFFVFPFLDFHLQADVFAIAAAVTLGVVLAGVAQAVGRVRRMTPTEAMRPPVPPSFAGPFARLIARLRWLDEPSRIVLRGLARRPVRTGLGAIGVGAALGLYITSAGSRDNVAMMIDIMFDQSNRADVMVLFAEPKDERVLFELARVPGVWRVEPMRAVSARLDHRTRQRTEAITAARPGGDLYRLVGLASGAIDPPPRGVLISAGLAEQLDLDTGDLLTITLSEGRQARFDLPVTGIIKSPVGSPAFVDMQTLASAQHEPLLSSGAYLGVDPARTDALYRWLKDTPGVAGVTLRAAARSGIEQTIGETMGIVTLFNTGFSALIVFGVIYNNARISLAERGRDLASLRVLGYRRSEVSYILLAELALIVVLGIPVGIGFGWWLSRALSEELGGDLFDIPFALSAGTVATAVLVVMLAAAATALLVRRRLDRLDLVAVLKTWD